MHENKQKDFKQEWEKYCEQELRETRPILLKLGFTLDGHQPHLGGERFLMSAKKLVLLGERTSDGKRVVVKASSKKDGIREIEKERLCRETLLKIKFAYHTFFSPKEIFFGTENGRTLFITEFIPQTGPFLGRPVRDQFALALQIFKTQEGAHATAYGHMRALQNVFESWGAGKYLSSGKDCLSAIQHGESKHVASLAQGFLREHEETIEKYCGFLTHWDFVPHNFRVNDGKIYLLDHSSIRFGNKYESWARFANFMTLYNPPLEEALIFYIKNNRTSEEYLSFRLMRVYRLIELIAHHAKVAEKASENFRELSNKRVLFWGKVLRSVLEDKPLLDKIRDEYKQSRDLLRNEGEKRRQEGLH